MCCMGYQTPTGGIPISKELQEQYPESVNAAWTKFHNWWINSGKQPRRADMPKDVAEAYEIIKAAPIPGYPGHTGTESCYVLGVERALID